MSIKLSVDGRPPIELDDENITVGGDPGCSVSFPTAMEIKSKHAVIRKIAGRWLIEVREADAIFVGGTEPKRMAWLNPGDVIHLTENGHTITFQPDLQDNPFLQATPGRKPQPVERAPLESDDPPLLPVSKPVKPASSAAIRVPKPPSSATIPTSRVPLSDTIPTVKGPKSGTIPTSKAPLSGTIRSVPLSDDEIPVPKSSRSGSSIPIPGAKLSRSSGQVPVPKPKSSDMVADVPPLERMSSWDELPGRRQLTDEQAEMRWIMQIVGRSVGAGLVVLVVWLAISWVIKSLKPAPIETLTASQALQQNTIVATEPMQRPPVENTTFGVAPVRPKTTQPRDSQPPKKKTFTEPVSDPAMTTEPSESKPTEPPAVADTGSKPAPERPMTDEPAARAAENDQASPARRAVQEGLYAVMMENSDQSRRIQVGTAWAISKRYLVTSASVVMAIEENQQQGMIASVVQFATDKQYRVKGERLHDSYRKAVEGAEEAREKRDDERFAKERANQVRFDLGVLDIGRNDKLPHPLKAFTEALDESKESVFIMVGLPGPEKETEDIAEVDVNSIKERRCKKPAIGASPQNKDMELTIQFALDSNGRNWAGSPVLNKDFKVIGIYSQLPQPKAVGGKPVKREHGVAWIGRLHEFASDVE